MKCMINFFSSCRKAADEIKFEYNAVEAFIYCKIEPAKNVQNILMDIRSLLLTTFVVIAP